MRYARDAKIEAMGETMVQARVLVKNTIMFELSEPCIWVVGSERVKLSV